MPTTEGLFARIAAAFGYLAPGTRVDPDLFAEDEYPVYCLTCGYHLRGVGAPRCPECGTEFDRGQLLVDFYARGQRPRTSPTRKLLTALSAAARVCELIGWLQIPLGLVLLTVFHSALLPTSFGRAIVVVTAYLVAPYCVYGLLLAARSWVDSATGVPRARRNAVRQAARDAVRQTRH